MPLICDIQGWALPLPPPPQSKMLGLPICLCQPLAAQTTPLRMAGLSAMVRAHSPSGATQSDGVDEFSDHTCSAHRGHKATVISTAPFKKGVHFWEVTVRLASPVQAHFHPPTSFATIERRHTTTTLQFREKSCLALLPILLPLSPAPPLPPRSPALNGPCLPFISV